MEVHFFLCAEAAVIDASSNKLTIVNVAEEFAAGGFPAVIPQLSVVCLLSKKKAEPDKVQINIVGFQSSQEMFTIPMEVGFQGKLRTRIVAAIQGIVIPGAGKFVVSLNHRKKTLASWPIAILDVRAATASAAVVQPPVASTTSFPKKAPVRKRRK